MNVAVDEAGQHSCVAVVEDRLAGPGLPLGQGDKRADAAMLETDGHVGADGREGAVDEPSRE